MAVPDFQSFFKPLLEVAGDGAEHTIKEAREAIATNFNLTDEDRAERLPSGTQTKFDNRVAWAKSYFIQAKVLESSKRAFFKITERGKLLLSQGHERIDIRILSQYPEFVEFHTPSKQNKSTVSGSQEDLKHQRKFYKKPIKAFEMILLVKFLISLNQTPPLFLRIS